MISTFLCALAAGWRSLVLRAPERLRSWSYCCASTTHSRDRFCWMGTICANSEFKTLRENIAVITHEPCLFHCTIEENIRYGNPHATAQDIHAAAQAADVHEFILSLPHGYQTVVGEKGIGLSAGQRQRIAIARAILRKAKVWLFDEATATLDVLTESRIREAMDRWLGEHTSIIVTHRLSSVVDMDRIVVMEGGRITQVGDHRQLLRMEGLYQQLHLAAQRHRTLSSPVPVAT